MCSGDQEKATVWMISSGLVVPRGTGEHMDAQPNLLVGTGRGMRHGLPGPAKRGKSVTSNVFPFYGKSPSVGWLRLGV